MDVLTNFHGAQPPPSSVLFPSSSPFTPDKGQAVLILGSGNGMDVREGTIYDNVERQLNVVDTFSWAVGIHQFKFGFDYRRMTPRLW